MRKLRDKLKKIAQAAVISFLIYAVAYMINSAAGGYWMIPERDGRVRFKREFGGLSMTVAIMWQPRIGHNALAEFDFFGVLFEPLILLDRAWVHPTRYMIDEDFGTWLNTLSPSMVHPKFREEFIHERAKRAG